MSVDSSDLAMIRNEIGRAVRRDQRRRSRRRKTVRTGALSFAALFALSASSLAAADALNVIDLGGGVTAERVPSGSQEPPAGKVISEGGPRIEPPKYRYRLHGVPAAGGGPAAGGRRDELYIGSDKPPAPGEVTVTGGELDPSESHDPRRGARRAGP